MTMAMIAIGDVCVYLRLQLRLTHSYPTARHPVLIVLILIVLLLIVIIISIIIIVVIIAQK